ncbi:unnamed protein product [Sphagnum tenellum]
MEKEMGHVEVDSLSHSSRPFHQHQFFPGGNGKQPLLSNRLTIPVEQDNGPWSSSSNRDRSDSQGMENSSRRKEWDMKAWNWDSVMFVAQPASVTASGSANEGTQRHSVDENGGHRRAPEFTFQLEGSSGAPRQPLLGDSRSESELQSRSFFDRETPSPPQNGAKSLKVDGTAPEEVGSLGLKLGGISYPIVEEDGSGSHGVKRTRSSSPQSQVPMCQVDNCKADLSKAKDYHRRHKVCDMHSKAANASVMQLMQRFCQQCSRFHPLPEFDEGKRSCRRRLEGHNRRRRKTQTDPTARSYLMGDDDLIGRGGAGLVSGLLHILAQLQVLASLEDRTTPLWNSLIPNLDSLAAGLVSRQEQVAPSNGHTSDLSIATQQLLSRLAGGSSPEVLALLLQSTGQLPTSLMHVLGSHPLIQERAGLVPLSHASSSTPDLLTCPLQREVGHSSFGCASGVPAPTDHRLPVSRELIPKSTDSSLMWKNPTRRISLKLFDRTPEDLPHNLRMQIDAWLEHRPTDMESYIKPGCVVLTIYVSMPHSAWVELDRDLQRSLEKLLNTCSGVFWHKGRILVQVEQQMVLIVDGNIVERKLVDPLSQPYIQSVRPIAIVAGQETNISCNGFNLARSGTRLLCVYQGKNLSQSVSNVEDEEADNASGGADVEVDEVNSYGEEGVEDCAIMVTADRAIFEVEQNLSGGNSKPVIVANTLVCKELCKLEEEIEAATLCAAEMAEREGLESGDILICSEVARALVEEDVACFLHELGWYFQNRSYWQFIDSASLDMVHAFRLKCLLVFSVERDWCTVVQKLLDMPFQRAESDSLFAKLSHVVQDEISLLHRAVCRKCRPMVELLLAYVPSSLTKESDFGLENFQRIMQFKLQWGNFFRPDMAGPAGLTPLHIAASMQDAEDVVDALTSDPCQVGLHAWVSKQDESGQTPLSLALVGGNIKSIQLVRAKLALLESMGGSVAINIPGDSLPHIQDQRPCEASKSAVPKSLNLELPFSSNQRSASGVKLNTGKARFPCSSFGRQAGNPGGIVYAYIPKSFLLSLVTIATICVCVCLLFKDPPFVTFVRPPFRWDSLGSGPQ